MSKPKLSAEERLNHMVDWFTWFLSQTDTFEVDDLALDLSYLWPAIAKGTTIEVRKGSALLRLIEQRGEAAHTIRPFLTIVDG